MLDHRDRVCVPIEVEMLPLYREPGSARWRREQRRADRRRRRESPAYAPGILARLTRRAGVRLRRRRA